MSETSAESDFESDHLFANLSDNAIDSLSRAAAFASDSDQWRWKWVAFSLHHSLYTFCLAALHRGNSQDQTTSGKSPPNDKGVKVWSGPSMSGRVSRIERVKDTPAYRIKWDRIGEEAPDGTGPVADDDEMVWPSESKTIGFWTALARVMDSYHYMDIGSKPLELTDDEIRSIAWLALKVRNNLMHFVPHHNWIHIQSISETAVVYVKAIESLTFDTHAILLSTERRQRIRSSIDQLSALLNT